MVLYSGIYLYVMQRNLLQIDGRLSVMNAVMVKNLSDICQLNAEKTIKWNRWKMMDACDD